MAPNHWFFVHQVKSQKELIDVEKVRINGQKEKFGPFDIQKAQNGLAEQNSVSQSISDVEKVWPYMKSMVGYSIDTICRYGC